MESNNNNKVKYIVSFKDYKGRRRTTEQFVSRSAAEIARKTIKILTETEPEINTIPTSCFVGPAYCGLCGYSWEAFIPDGLNSNKIECPNCNKIIDADLALKTGE
jgi:hypothetical protein